MKKILMIGLLVGTVAIVAGCGTQTPTPAPQSQQPTTQNTTTPNQTPAPSTTTPTTAGSGKDVYDKNCSACHGAGGAGASAPPLNTEKRTQAQVLNITKKGKESMPGYATVLNDAEIQAVAQYVADLKK
ncbi:cytochrome c [Desulfosporosinus sp. BG]|uniref:c-type cytochrome n=1 Tax=Desulfosporosinus sp. BG TaxID=1633135 RepID=UPI00083A43E1|nr:cytochrome c [Desulfosporosinus sp. BG]ODA40622.1 hypothetical protein DSBG_2617 [Desulfosporosinus sp. BG]